MSDSGCKPGCTCDDWAEYAQVRKDSGQCGTCGEPEPCTFCPAHFGPRDDTDRWPA